MLLIDRARPPVLDQLGLTTAVREYAATLSRGENGDEPTTPLTVVLDMPDHLPTLPAAVEVAAYRIICYRRRGSGWLR